jgi:hypothetical protein
VLLKIFFRSLNAPIFSILRWKIFNLFNPNALFFGNDYLFKKTIKNKKIYGEYGCGESTSWILKNTKLKVISVDTSNQWIQSVLNENFSNKNRLNIKHADLGKVGNMGRPNSYVKSEMFSIYTDWIWYQEDKPSVVLIDGRFRVCCFLTSIKFAEEGTKILFDDYTSRPHYHFIEKYVNRIEECGRQCLFEVPSKNEIDFISLEEDIKHFRYVMD